MKICYNPWEATKNLEQIEQKSEEVFYGFDTRMLFKPIVSKQSLNLGKALNLKTAIVKFKPTKEKNCVGI